MLRFIIIISICSYPALAQENSVFNTSFLKFSDVDLDNVDLSHFNKPGAVPPGVYHVRVYVNNEHKGSYELNFQRSNITSTGVKAELDSSLLVEWGVMYPEEAVFPLDIATLIPEATEKFNIQQYRLDIEVPQKWLVSRGWFNELPHKWDYGVPALLINYDYSGYQQRNDNSAFSGDFVSLNSSLNMARWRFINQSIISNDNDFAVESLSSYAQHDYAFGQGGTLTLGQTSSSADYFDSYQFTGVSISSEDSMIANSLRNYSAIIRGVSYSNATVYVRQRGTLLYQENVAPGEFELRDFSAPNGSELQVEIVEENGEVRYFTQNVSSVPILQREGRVRYAFSSGNLRHNRSELIDDFFLQGELAWGVGGGVTLLGGMQFNKNYLSSLIGGGIDAGPIGGASLTLTHARYHEVSGENPQVGYKYEFDYAKTFGDKLTVNASYQRANEDYKSLSELTSVASKDIDYSREMSQLSNTRYNVGISTSLNSLGGGTLSGYYERLIEKKEERVNLSYNDDFFFAKYNVLFGYAANQKMKGHDKSIGLNISIPLSSVINSSMSSRASYLLHNDKSRRMIGVSGMTDSRDFSYSISRTFDEASTDTNNASVSYHSGNGQFSLGYGKSEDSERIAYSARGGVVLHENGLTLSDSLSMVGGNVLLSTNGIEDIQIKNTINTKTDIFGNVVVTGLPGYHQSNVSFDVDSLPHNVEVVKTDYNIIPTKGALIGINADVYKGHRALLQLFHNGKYVPFGSTVQLADSTKKITGIVSNEGWVYLAGMPDNGKINASWIDINGGADSCQADINFAKNNDSVIKQEVECQ